MEGFFSPPLRRYLAEHRSLQTIHSADYTLMLGLSYRLLNGNILE